MSVTTTAIWVAIILFVRRPDALLFPQFRWEDSTVFFLQQWELGFWKVLFAMHAGYFHFIPRLIAGLASLFPVSMIPAIYNWSCLVITTMVSVSILSKRIALPHRWLLALAVVMVPQWSGAVFLTLSHLQWIMAIPLLMLLFKTPAKTTLEKVVDVIILVLCGLTGPFLAMWSPLLIWRWWSKKPLPTELGLSITVATIAVFTAARMIQLGEFSVLLLIKNMTMHRYSYLAWFALAVVAIKHLPMPSAQLCLAVMLGLSFGLGFSWRMDSKPYLLTDMHWQEYAAKIGHETVTIPVNPMGWQITVRLQ